MATTTPHLLPTSDEELLDWLQLSRSENIGPLTFQRLLERYKKPREAIVALPELAARGGLKRPLHIIPRSMVEKELNLTREYGAKIITLENPLYPPLLRHIDSAPPVITVKGQLSLLQAPLFAIVGARNASAMGKKMAYQFAQLLGMRGWIITSGLARGIDSAAHQGSLERGTIAVLAGGVDQVYPLENQPLYNRIGEEGVLIAESAFGIQPQSSLFPRRNRVISGLSRSVLIVEAALKSGSLITARYALEQGRDVFAIPGHPLDPRVRGCNYLIKKGAVLVETIEDIEEETFSFQPIDFKEMHPPFPPEMGSFCLEKTRSLIKENLSYVPISVDELIRECQLQATDVWVVLLEMEIAGYLERHPGAKVSLKKEWKNV